jgi:serine/threonine protein kinase
VETDVANSGHRHRPDYSIKDVETLWGDAVSPDAPAGMSIKVASTATYAAADLLLRKRGVADRGPTGTLVGRRDFELAEVLGKGGMGVVYSARQASLDRKVAVKMIEAGSARMPTAKTKFMAEALVTGDLEHPNIVPIYELGGTEDGLLFYAMKEVRGASWDETVRNGSTADNLEILLRVCDAVAFAHDRGVIHRDLKPSNVMVGDYGEVLVMDWGLAVSAGGDIRNPKAAELTHASGRAGTPAYMAPEMARCEVERIGPASDIYLLGGILYELATGLRPHSGDSAYECISRAMANEIHPIVAEI